MVIADDERDLLLLEDAVRFTPTGHGAHASNVARLDILFDHALSEMPSLRRLLTKQMPPNPNTAYDRCCEARHWKPSNHGHRVAAITSVKPVGSGEQSTVATAIIKDEHVPDVVHARPVLHKPEDASARFFTAAFIQDEGDEDIAMAKHLRDSPKPEQHVLATPAATSKMPRMIKPAQMSALH